MTGDLFPDEFSCLIRKGKVFRNLFTHTLGTFNYIRVTHSTGYVLLYYVSDVSGVLNMQSKCKY